MTKRNKEKVLNNLGKWSLYEKTEFIKANWWGGMGENVLLDENEAQEVRKKIISVIKENPHEWRIEEKKIYSNTIDFFVVHQSVKEIKMLLGGILKENTGKIHYKDGFNKEEWKEIENILTNPQLEQNKLKYPNKEDNWGGKEIGLIGVAIAVVLFVIYLVKKYLPK